MRRRCAVGFRQIDVMLDKQYGAAEEGEGEESRLEIMARQKVAMSNLSDMET